LIEIVVEFVNSASVRFVAAAPEFTDLTDKVVPGDIKTDGTDAVKFVA